MLIVGSTALEKFGIHRREPKDFDVWITEDEEPVGDFFVVTQDVLNMVPNVDGYATPDAIYTIKCSHFGWDVLWEKTKQDILWLKSKGGKVIPELYFKLKNTLKNY